MPTYHNPEKSVPKCVQRNGRYTTAHSSDRQCYKQLAVHRAFLPVHADLEGVGPSCPISVVLLRHKQTGANLKHVRYHTKNSRARLCAAYAGNRMVLRDLCVGKHPDDLLETLFCELGKTLKGQPDNRWGFDAKGSIETCLRF